MTITITLDGDVWEIIGEGATRDGKTYCHLASTTRFRKQKNGQCPVQMCDWIENDWLAEHPNTTTTGEGACA